MAEDSMVRLHHWLYRHEFEQIPGDRGGQRSLCATYCSWVCRVEHNLATEELQHMKHSYVYEKQLYIVEAYTWKRDNIVEK